MSQPALFLDRDGVINVDHGYVYKPENFEFIEGIFDLVRKANDYNYKVIVITNQAGIGRGYYTEGQFNSLTKWMCHQFDKHSARIDAVYFCPFHPEHGVGLYRQESFFRKPAPGMLLLAKKEHDLNLGSSILVGDKPSDIEAGRGAGVGQLFYLSLKPLAQDVNSVQSLDSVTQYVETKNGR